MKHFSLIGILSAVLLCMGFASCSDGDDEGSGAAAAELQVTYANLDGTWQLTEWNGRALADGTYCYIVFERKDRTYRMYQKFDSMYARCITGEFSLAQDDVWGDVVSGTYDYGMGEWNRRYAVSDLLESGSMVWTALPADGADGDAGAGPDVCLYERVDGVPDEVLAEAE